MFSATLYPLVMSLNITGVSPVMKTRSNPCPALAALTALKTVLSAPSPYSNDL